jgi:hypothetical protein
MQQHLKILFWNFQVIKAIGIGGDCLKWGAPSDGEESICVT